MDWDNSHFSMRGYLYGKFIEEAVGNGKAYYHPTFFAPDSCVQYPCSVEGEGRSRPRYLLCVKLAGVPVLHIRLPRWVSVRLVFS